MSGNDNDENQHRQSESRSTTTVVTRSKNEGLRNELSFRMRDSTWTISGWKACVAETVSVGLMAAGLVYITMHGRDLLSSVMKK